MSDRGPGTPVSVESFMSGSQDDSHGDYHSINVVVRVRPVTSYEISRKDVQGVQFPAEGQISVEDTTTSGPEKSFTFNVVFEPEARQEDVFEYCGLKQLIDMALDGFACTVMAYGQTGSGKTFTLTGPQTEGNSKRNPPGIISLAFAYVYEQINQRKDYEYVVQASYLQIYNEQVLDLLNPSTKPLLVRWAKDRGFYAENLFIVECEDSGDLEGVLEEGNKNRQVRSHLMNEHSSRSHTILVLTLTSESRDPDDPQNFIRRHGKLTLVDLAGSEKTKKTNSRGEVLIQANNINKSLLVLGNVISSLSDPRKRSGHIPFRDSTLTKLLADSLCGSGMALMIACVSPTKSNAPETINTLRYAARAKKIKTKPVVRMDPRELLILSLKREVRLLRMENNFLRQQARLANGVKKLGSNEIVPKLTSSADSIEGIEKDVHSVVKRYMQENESLREENAQLHRMREILVHDHELVCRENEKLLRRLSEIDRASGHSPNALHYLKDSPSLRYLNNVSPNDSINGSSPLFKMAPNAPKLVEETGALADIKSRTLFGNKKTPRRQPNGISSEKRRVGRSLNDIPTKMKAPGSTPEQKPPMSQEDMLLQRRNSWGSSIPLSVGRIAKNRSSADSNSSLPSKLPPLHNRSASHPNDINKLNGRGDESIHLPGG